ncbi:MAG: penicillin-binding protein 1C [Spirochaetaceae bacterium]
MIPFSGRRFRAMALGYLAFWLLTAGALRLVPVPDPLFSGGYGTVVTDRRGEVLRVFLSPDEQWQLPPGSEIPENLKAAVLHFEDREFYRHTGVRLPSILRALRQNLSAGRRVSGGSTLTMQLARIADPKPRTVASKILELFQAWRIEGRYSKDDILALYLDHAPYGGNIRGVAAASMLYYGKAPESLTWGEAATLAVLPNAPSLVSPLSDGEALRQKRNRLLGSLHRSGYFDPRTLESALREPLPQGTVDLPFRAPHFSRMIATRTGRPAGGTGVITSSLDLELQQTLERLAGFHNRLLRRQGVTNLSVLVVDNPTGEVRGYIGSADFFDGEHAGQVDGVWAPRSTGSILKPFLYALAIDDGLLLPGSLLEDIPVNFGGFSPENIDRRYRGLVPMEEALTASLNVPAALTLSQVGLERFYFLLENGGLSTLFRPPGDYGLPLVLGGAEASPWDVARLYRGLATGDFSDLSVELRGAAGPQEAGTFGGGTPVSARGPVGAQTPGSTRSPISPGARHLILETLKDVQRPGAEALWGRFQDGFPVAWKTGTSYGRRDAWAVGLTPEWTVVVWAGDFAGRPNPDLRSTSAAAPLLFDILNTLRQGREPTWFSPPPGAFDHLEVCAETGYRATVACEETRYALVPRGARPLRRCPYHERIYVSSNTNRRVDSRCWSPGEYEAKNVLVVPPAAAAYLPTVPPVPPWEAACGAAGDEAVAITYPNDNARLYLPRRIDGASQGITLRASHREAGTRIFWYLDEVLVGETERHHNILARLEPGDHVLTVVDAGGHRDSVRFRVEGLLESKN